MAFLSVDPGVVGDLSIGFSTHCKRRYELILPRWSIVLGLKHDARPAARRFYTPAGETGDLR